MRRYLGQAFAADGVAIGLALIVAVVVFSLLEPAFWSIDNILNIIVQSAFIMLLAVGMAFVLTAGGIDLSVGAVLGFSAGVTMFVLGEGYWFGIAILAGLATGLFFGVLNGFLVARLGLNDFIVTLGSLGVAAGALRLLDSIRPLRLERVVEETEAFTFLAHGKVIGIPVPIIIAVGVVIGLEVLLKRSPFGRRVQAVGMRRDAAELAGINVARIRHTVFIMAGLLAAAAGILMAARLSSVPARLGLGFELQAIAAAVLGGTSLFGGRGTVVGAALAALLLATLNAGLQISGVDSTWYRVILGVGIVAAVAFHQWTVRFSAAEALGPSIIRTGNGPPGAKRRGSSEEAGP